MTTKREKERESRRSETRGQTVFAGSVFNKYRTVIAWVSVQVMENYHSNGGNTRIQGDSG